MWQIDAKSHCIGLMWELWFHWLVFLLQLDWLKYQWKNLFIVYLGAKTGEDLTRVTDHKNESHWFNRFIGIIWLKSVHKIFENSLEQVEEKVTHHHHHQKSD